MGFTVTRLDGTKDVDFETYTRLLRRHGKNLGKLPRVPDPANPERRWIPVWSTREDAQQFADELANECGNEWNVVATTDTPSEGSFALVLIQLTQRGDGLSFTLRSLSLAVLKELFPTIAPTATVIFIDKPTLSDYLKIHDGLGNLIEAIAPSLTGLNPDQLADLGYAVIDPDTDETWIHMPPAGIAQVHV